MHPRSFDWVRSAVLGVLSVSALTVLAGGVSSPDPRPSAAPVVPAVTDSGPSLAVLIRQACGERPALSDAASALLAQTGDAATATSGDLDAVVITYRLQGDQPREVCLQRYRLPADSHFSVLNPEGIVRERVGEDLYGPADRWLSMMYAPVQSWGDARALALQSRAFRTSFAGDLTLLREQTIDPLYVLVIIPRAGPLLPLSLRSRVQSLIFDARLSFGEWQGKVVLLTADRNRADQVALVVAAWRDLGGSLARRFASDGLGRSLQSALEASTLEAVNSRVVASMALPAPTVVRVSKELRGHGAPEKVAVCHKGHTVLVSEDAVPAHLAHGDTLGPCPGDAASNTR